MIFILDTNVVSAVRRPGRAPNVAAWLAARAESDLFLSVITIGEVERGIRLQNGRNPASAADLRSWMERTRTLFSDRILEFTAEDALIWGELCVRTGNTGAELMIASQALARDATVVSGNASDFLPTGARVYDPFV